MIQEDLIERAEDLEGEIERLRAARDLEALRAQVAQAEARLEELERALAYRKEHPRKYDVPRWAAIALALLVPVGLAWIVLILELAR